MTSHRSAVSIILASSALYGGVTCTPRPPSTYTVEQKVSGLTPKLVPRREGRVNELPGSSVVTQPLSQVWAACGSLARYTSAPRAPPGMVHVTWC